MTDPIADMLTRIRNAQAVSKEDVIIPFSKIKLAIAKILVDEGFIKGFDEFNETNRLGSDFKYLRLFLRYTAKDKKPMIRQIKRISKPGRRVYRKHSELPHVLGGLGLAIISTPSGLMTNREARRKKVGGEIICEIY
ncbi:30S ribosomal protein S8 [Patescibacteria group bacterium]|nr:30S ribosomal protein S8 [Patescibacteria group bacterium]